MFGVYAVRQPEVKRAKRRTISMRSISLVFPKDVNVTQLIMTLKTGKLSVESGSRFYTRVKNAFILKLSRVTSRTEQHTQNDNHRSHFWSFLKGVKEYTMVLGKRQPWPT